MLSAGTRLGAYEVLALIGEGGMGQVYRARDTKLGRDVAIKVLPETFAHDPDRLARFTREAHVLASLNHPNIAHLYGFEAFESGHALVMELVDGDPPGLLDIADALPIARQIIDALEAAHEHGIIHRDLKPANIKVRADGTTKVLDFGLAKAVDGGGPSSATGASNSPTLTSPAMTGLGVLLGTAAYMAPEQARGKLVDQRADIWAFGCVLFEMLTGKSAFGDEDISLTLSNVLRADPDFSVLPDNVPGHVRHVIRLCLRKDPRQRISDVRDLRLLLDGAVQDTAGVRAPAVASRRSRWRVPAMIAAAVSIAGLASAVTAWRLRAPAPSIIRFEQDGPRFRSTSRRVVAISPDGRRFLLNTADGLLVREMNEATPRRLPGTDVGLTDPTFSPDGGSIAFVQAGQLKRISITGGQPVPICPATLSYGISWNSDGTIVFGLADGIWRVSDNGGTPTQIAKPEPGELLAIPQMLPGGEWLLMTSRRTGPTQVVALSLRTSERKVVAEAAADGLFVEPGYLLYLSVDGAMIAIAFDPAKAETRGQRVAVLPAVMTATTTGEAQLSVSRNGSLAYVPGNGADALKIVWVDRNGTPAGDITTALGARYPALSPDGRFVAYVGGKGGDGQIFRYDRKTTTTTQISVLTTTNNDRPLWSPDGESIAYNTITGGNREIVIRRSDASGEIRTVVAAPGPDWLGDWWKGPVEYLLFDRENGEGGLWYISRRSPTDAWHPARKFRDGPGVVAPKLSPNGRYVAYVTRRPNEPNEVEVMTFPTGDQRWKISNNGGTRIHWSRDGTELFYVQAQDLMSVRVSTTGELNPSRPARVFRWAGLQEAVTDAATFDVSQDGKQFVVVEVPDTQPTVQIVLNWIQELEKLLP